MLSRRMSLFGGAAVIGRFLMPGVCVAQSGKSSPQILPDRRVVFQLKAPAAHQVLVEGDFEDEAKRRDELVKGDDGVWTFTTEPLDPDYYSYNFIVDGVPLADPLNGLSKPGIPMSQSVFAVPGPEAADMQVQPDVPHGEIRQVFYTSSLTGRTRRLHVYLPPDYEKGRRSYPVVYLLHGSGDDDSVWTSPVGRANVILDNLIARGQSRSMILVMPDLRAMDHDFDPQANLALFRQELVSDIIPFVDHRFRTIARPAGRAIGGLGMGRPWLPEVIWPVMDTFGEILFASGGVSQPLFGDLQKSFPGVVDRQKTRQNVRFFLGVGAGDASRPDSENLAGELRQRSYKVATFQGMGGHGWPAFRRAFKAFAMQAFSH